MIKLQNITIYLLAAAIFFIFLRIFGLIYLNINEIFGYAFILFGISAVSLMFGRNRRGVLFIGSAIFLIGLLIIVIYNFDIIRTNAILLPSLLFILGISFLLLFIDDTKNKSTLYLFLIFSLVGLAMTLWEGTITFGRFSNSIIDIIKEFWIIIVLAILLIAALLIGERK